MTFKSDLNKFTKKTNAKTEQALRSAALELFGKVIIKSPVGNTSLWQTKYPPSDYKGGRFRANWNTSIRMPDLSAARKPEKSAAAAKTQMRVALGQLKLGQTIWFTNNLPYAKAIETGHSTQAPIGVVKTTVKSWKSAINRAANKVKNK